MDHNDTSSFLYKDLPSIAPRVSRSERLATKRGGCSECELDNSIKKVKKNTQSLYRFFLVVVVFSFFIIQIQNQQTNDNNIPSDTKLIDLAKGHSVVLTLIQEKNRHGLSMLLRNKNTAKWDINTVVIQSKNTNLLVEINQTIAKDEFYTEFVPLPLEITNADLINILEN